MRNDANSCLYDPSTPKVADAIRFSTVSNKSRRSQQVPGCLNTGVFHLFVSLVFTFLLGGSFSPQDTGGSLSSSSLRPAVRICSPRFAILGLLLHFGHLQFRALDVYALWILVFSTTKTRDMQRPRWFATVLTQVCCSVCSRFKSRWWLLGIDEGP